MVHTVKTSGDEAWYDEASYTSRSVHRDRDGMPLWEVGPAVAPALDGPPNAEVASRQINHCRSEYADVTSVRYTEIGVSEPEIIRDQLARGDLVADGTEVVDGRELIRLVDTTPAASSRELVYYVDPDTYRPMLARISAGDSERRIIPETVTVEYLPRTSENLSQLVPPVPEGFTQVTDVDERFVLSAACD